MKAAIAAFLLLSVSLHAAETTGDKILDEALAKPGGYNQMCGLPPAVAMNPPLKLYGLNVPRHFHLSGEVGDRLLAKRKDVIPALVGKLEAMDLRNLPPKPEPPKGSVSFPPDAGFDGKRPSGVLLDVVIKLEAVEAIPALLKLEQQLFLIIMEAGKDASVPVPELEVDGIILPQELSQWVYVKDKKPVKKPNAKELQRKTDILVCRVYQREILSILAKLMRGARYQPLLDSEIEAAYAKRLKEAAKPEIKSEKDIPADDRGYVRWDPLYNLAAPTLFPKPELPFTPELREKIRGFAQQYVAEQARK